MKEDNFVDVATAAAKSVIGPPLTVERGASLLYQVIVDNKLTVRVDPKRPKRGQAAFQTDLCIFEQVDTDVKIPRVVLEFKKGLSTHDVLIYSSKARQAGKIIPELRKYNQNHFIKLPGLKYEGDGFAELWFDDLEGVKKYLAWRQTAGAQPLLEDENKFLDRSKTVRYVVEEYFIIK